MDLPLEEYAGLYIQRDELKIENPMVHYREKELESFPLPYRDDFDHPAYQKVWQEHGWLENHFHHHNLWLPVQL